MCTWNGWHLHTLKTMPDMTPNLDGSLKAMSVVAVVTKLTISVSVEYLHISVSLSVNTASVVCVLQSVADCMPLTNNMYTRVALVYQAPQRAALYIRRGA